VGSGADYAGGFNSGFFGRGFYFTPKTRKGFDYADYSAQGFQYAEDGRLLIVKVLVGGVSTFRHCP
jgi:hypothetical protein